MGEIKAKKPVRRFKVADGNSPIPSRPSNNEITSDAVCGHSGCSRQCQVRYIGPTTHVRDHQIFHAARGSTHAWTAALVAGLAVVLTGALAYTAVEAETPKVAVDRATIKDLSKRISSLEDVVQQVLNQCQFTPLTHPPTATDECVENCKINGIDDEAVNACIAQNCSQQPKPADDSRAACLDKCKQLTSDSSAVDTTFDQCVKINCAALTR